MSLAVILLGMPILLTPHRIRPSTFELIKVGMTEDEVEELLGVKPGTFDGYDVGSRRVHGTQVPRIWCSRHGAISVWFDDKGRVSDRSAEWPEPSTWWGRFWHRHFPPTTERAGSNRQSW